MAVIGSLRMLVFFICVAISLKRTVRFCAEKWLVDSRTIRDASNRRGLVFCDVGWHFVNSTYSKVEM